MNRFLIFRFFENDTRIQTAKPEVIGQGISDVALLSHIERVVHLVVNLFILIAFRMVDSWRDNSCFERFNASDSFDSSCSTYQMACH